MATMKVRMEAKVIVTFTATVHLKETAEAKKRIAELEKAGTGLTQEDLKKIARKVYIEGINEEYLKDDLDLMFEGVNGAGEGGEICGLFEVED
jgi:hypothetical protein